MQSAANASQIVTTRFTRINFEKPIVTIMAQLVTKKEKYGVSVAARIDPEIAHQISERAERLGISFAKMVAMLIAKGFNPQEPVYVENREDIERLEDEINELNQETYELRDSLETQRKLYQNAAAKFIEEIAEDQENQIHFAESYNQILSDLKEEQS